MQRVTNAYLLSVQYKNKGNEEKAQYYENVSKSLVEGSKGKWKHLLFLFSPQWTKNVTKVIIYRTKYDIISRV